MMENWALRVNGVWGKALTVVIVVNGKYGCQKVRKLLWIADFALLPCQLSDFTVSEFVSSSWDDVLWSFFTNRWIILQTHLEKLSRKFVGEKLIFTSRLHYFLRLLLHLLLSSEAFNSSKWTVYYLIRKIPFLGLKRKLCFPFLTSSIISSLIFWEKCCEARRHV